jgi:ubiquinone/menaquinone biosynthesis C-methylase UbiE
MDTSIIDSVTGTLVANGHRVFQIHRFAENEFTHVSRLERWAEFPLNAKVIDLGCGVGEVSKIMQEIRKDMTFTLVNISEVQLSYADDKFKKYCCDFCNVPEKEETYDAAMFLFSIGHGDKLLALKEAFRLLKVGGVLFIYDMVRVSGDNSSMVDVQYEVDSKDSMNLIARECGFNLDLYIEPRDIGSYGHSLLGDTFNKVFNGTIPACWRFIKC